MKEKRIGNRQENTRHFAWDNSLPPVLDVSPGEEVTFDLIDGSCGQITENSLANDLANLNWSLINPLAGPVRIIGAEPGDALSLTFLDYEASGWGWTGIIPGLGLLAEDFADPFLMSIHYNGKQIGFTQGIEIPANPFPGTIGTAPAEPGRFSTNPPRYFGGNIDIKDITKGAKILLPVAVNGALLSMGDPHAAQGDGEVCGTAVESPIRFRVRLDVIKKANLKSPQFETGRAYRDAKGYFATTGIAGELMQASKDAIRRMIEHLTAKHNLSPQTAYCLCSVAADLRISEVVDTPNWVVSAYLPKSIFQ